MKTIKEISEAIGISRVSLYKLIKKPELAEHIKKEGNTTYISDIGEQIIIEYYSRQRLATLNDILDGEAEAAEEGSKIDEMNSINKANEQVTQVNESVDGLVNNPNEPVKQVTNDGSQGINDGKYIDIVEILENQLYIKDGQLKEKDNQIRMKDEQIKQKDNQLNAVLILLNKEKDIRLISDNSVASVKMEASADAPKGFFSRIFRKR